MLQDASVSILGWPGNMSEQVRQRAAPSGANVLWNGAASKWGVATISGWKSRQ